MALITTGEAAKMCGVTRQTILNWGEKGLLTIKKFSERRNGSWDYAIKEEIEEICSTAQDISKLKEMLEAERNELLYQEQQVKEASKNALTELELINPNNMFASKWMIMSMLEACVNFGIIKERECNILEGITNGKTFSKIGEEMGISRERTRQLYERACRRIKSSANLLDKLKEYDKMKEEYETMQTYDRLIKVENDKLREQLDIKQKKDEMETLQEKMEYLNKVDDICKLLSKKVRDCDLSVRALNCLYGADIETVADLVQYNKIDLLKFRNFGKKSLTEIDDFLERNGLQFGMDVHKLFLERIELHFQDKENENECTAIIHTDLDENGRVVEELEYLNKS